METLKLFTAALIGGLATSVLIPIVSFFFLRTIAKYRTDVQRELPTINLNNGYVTLNLRVTNRSFNSLKNVIVFITINYNDQDLFTSENLKTYTVSSIIRPMTEWPAEHLHQVSDL